MNFKINKFLIIFLLLSFNILFSASTDNKIKNDPFSQKSFVPDISFIFDFAYISRGIGNSDLSQISMPGFLGEGSSNTALKNGFNVPYGSLTLYSAVDPYFELFTALKLTENSFKIGELYVRTQKIPFGMQFKFGKFLSSFGRINEQHAHSWDFFEIPLIYRAVFGGGYNDKGVQANWVAPTDLYIMFGFEAFTGNNVNCFGTNGFTVIDYENEDEIKVEDAKTANSYTFYLKSSIDIGELTFLYGASLMKGKARLNNFNSGSPHGFYGDTEIFGFDLTAKYFIDSYTYLSFQAEYINRDMSGTKYLANGDIDGNLVVAPIIYDKKQSGIYSQFIYRFDRLWRTGIRYDVIYKNDFILDVSQNSFSDNLSRISVMLEYSPTGFSRIRLQYNKNKYQFIDNILKENNELILNFNFSIGAHGAHSF